MLSLPPSTRLGHFEVLTPLGAGGQGWVFRARDTELRRDVALKVLADQGNDPAVRAKLLREARRAAQLNHPGICQVFHVGDSPHGPFMVMELVDGQTLAAVVAAGPLQTERACRIGKEIAQALDHAHAHGIVHRDLKCANVMLTREGRVKVLDFGIASVLPGVDLEHSLTATMSGDVGQIGGTLPYMAPEVLRGDAASISSDVWALGVVLYEMTTGRRPFDRQAPSELVAAILRDSPAAMASDVPPPIALLVARCLSKDPAERPARAGEIALGLEIASVSTPSAATRLPAAAAPLPWSRWRSATTLGGIAAAVASLAWFAVRSEPAPAPGRPPRFANPLQVTASVGVEEFPAWAPDGRMLAYSSSPTGNASNSPAWDVWVAQPGGGAPINRTGDYPGRDLFPSWSPDGSQLAFWSDRDGGGCYVMPPLAGAARRVSVASLLDPNPPQWSEDGSMLGCVSGDASRVGLDIVSVQTGQVARRIDLPGDGRRMFVTWSEPSDRIVLVASPAGLGADLTQLLALDVASGTVSALSDGQTKVWSPTWSADGQAIYYVAHAGATMDLWMQAVATDASPLGAPVPLTTGIGMRNASVSRDGHRLAYSQGRKVANLWRVPLRADRPATWNEAEQITFDQAFIECVDVNATGTRLAICSDRAGSFDLWTLPVGGGDMTQITMDPGAEWCPAWSPDGSTLAFFAHRTGNREIWTMPAAGGQWRQLTTNPGPDLHPSWSPDGRVVAHLTNRAGTTGGWATPIDGSAGRMIAPGGTLRWSPRDVLLAFTNAGRLWITDTTGHEADRALVTSGSGPMRWTPDGRSLLYRASQDRILGVNVDGPARERVLVDLSGRRGSLGDHGTPTDGQFIYFAWNDDLADVWVMDAVPEAP